MSDETPTSAGETEKERVDRELIEFLNEVRVVLPGVQVLFAFLLTLPFASTFDQIDGAERVAYIVAFFATAFSAVLMITPSSFHRLRFRKGDKEEILRTSNRLVLAGIVSLGVAMVAVVWLVAELVFTPTIANVIGIASALVLISLWFALPLSRRFVEGR
jgi:phosphatidylserine synthase